MTDQLGALTTIFTEFYYWITVVLMFLIHVGFCMYEVGASRYKHHQHTLMKNTMLIPLVTVTWFFFGWWIYWAFPTGPGIADSIMTCNLQIKLLHITCLLIRGCLWLRQSEIKENNILQEMVSKNQRHAL